MTFISLADTDSARLVSCVGKLKDLSIAMAEPCAKDVTRSLSPNHQTFWGRNVDICSWKSSSYGYRKGFDKVVYTLTTEVFEGGLEKNRDGWQLRLLENVSAPWLSFLFVYWKITKSHETVRKNQQSPLLSQPFWCHQSSQTRPSLLPPQCQIPVVLCRSCGSVGGITSIFV